MSTIPSDAHLPCPHCGGRLTTSTRGRDIGTITGGMAGATVMALRIIAKSNPILASTLFTGSLLGLLWGASTGRAIGTRIDQTFPGGLTCTACGKTIDP